MQRLNTVGIVLTRTNFGEADRIITFLTPERGKLKVMARGVRKQKSKLAGGIELFSVSDLTFISGKSDIGTLVSTRLIEHYSHIVKNLERTNAGYDFIKTLNKATEENPEAAYFDLLKTSFVSLDDEALDLSLLQAWFNAQLLRLAGHSPNLATEANGQKLAAAKTYHFDFDSMGFYANGSETHSFSPNHIKFLRLIFSDNKPKVLQKVSGVEQLAAYVRPLLTSMLQAQLHI